MRHKIVTLLLMALFLLPGAATAIEKRFIDYSGAETGPDWPYRIPVSLTDGSINPIRLDMRTISASPASLKKILMVIPYVLHPDTNEKQYFTRDPRGYYRPVSGKELDDAIAFNQVLRFDAWIFTEKIKQTVEEVIQVKVFGMTPAHEEEGTTEKVMTGNFRELSYSVWLMTNEGDMILDRSPTKWILGVIGTPPEDYWALAIMAQELYYPETVTARPAEPERPAPVRRLPPETTQEQVPVPAPAADQYYQVKITPGKYQVLSLQETKLFDRKDKSWSVITSPVYSPGPGEIWLNRSEVKPPARLEFTLSVATRSGLKYVRPFEYELTPETLPLVLVDTETIVAPREAGPCPGQDPRIDRDQDGIPDCIDKLIDSDNDTIADADDRCPGRDDLVDVDNDKIPDCVDKLIDSDFDGIADLVDRCPGKDDTIDVDRDLIPDCLDKIIDSDHDGIADTADRCPGQDDTIDVDHDKVPDCLDQLVDSDRDTVADAHDRCPGQDDTIDVDQDLVPDCIDPLIDTDRDSVADIHDKCPGQNDTIDVDQDNIPDCVDPMIDTDRDGITDAVDRCPGQDDTIDLDHDQVPDCIDRLIDSDRDSVADADDRCPGSDDTIDADNDRIPDCIDTLIDSDRDGIADASDRCPGQDDTIDQDEDRVPDCLDSLIDSDRDGIADASDRCPGQNDAIDQDGDSIPDCIDPEITPAEPETAVVNSLLFPLADVPRQVRHLIRTANDIALDNANINGQAARLAVRLQADRFEVISLSGPLKQNDKIAFTLTLPGLHPLFVLQEAGAHQPQPYSLKQQLNLEALDQSGVLVSGIRFLAQFTNRADLAMMKPTDTNGQTVLDIPPGVSELSVSYPGDGTYEAVAPVKIAIHKEMRQATESILLSRRAAVTMVQARVVDPQGQPVPGAVVGISLNGEAIFTQLTPPPDPTKYGLYSAELRLRAGDRLSYTATAPFFQKAAGAAPLSPDQLAKPITIVLQPEILHRQLQVTVIAEADGADSIIKNARGFVSFQGEDGRTQEIKLVYDQQSQAYLAAFSHAATSQPTVHFNTGKLYEDYQGPVVKDVFTVELNYAKPFLYVFINPNNQLKRGPILENPANNFGRFKESFLYLVEALDSDLAWRDRFSKIFIYTVNRNLPPTVLREPDGFKISWHDPKFRQDILNQIRLGNSFVPYEQVVDHINDSLASFSFADEKPMRAAFLYILGSPPELIIDPDEELAALEKLLAKSKIRGVVAQYGSSSIFERQNLTENEKLFQHLQLLHLNIDQEFKDNFFGSSMDYIKETLDGLLQD